MRRLWFLAFFLVAAGTEGFPRTASPAPLNPSPIPLAQVSSGQSVFGRNLIVNGDAEAGLGASGRGRVSVPGWQATESFTAVAYGRKKFPGPAESGNNFFAGGPGAALSTGSQVIDVSAAAAEIDQNAVRYELAGYLGGFSGWFPGDNQADYADLTATFKSGSGVVLGSATIGPVTPADRGNRTALVPRSTSGTLPAGTRSIEIVLRMVQFAGEYNDGYADNLSLVLNANIPLGGAAPLPASAPADVPKSARLQIATQPGSVQVYIDDEFKGMSGVEGRLVVSGLAPGSHRLRLTLIGYKEWAQTFDLTAGADKTIEAKLESAGPKPLELAEIEEALRNGVSNTRVAAMVKQFGVDFALSDEVELRLRAAGANDALIIAVAKAKK